MKIKQKAFMNRIANRLAAVLVMIGLMFKLQHWPYGEVILICGFALGGISLLFGKFKKS